MNAQLIPKWLFAKYAQLYQQFKADTFELEDISHKPAKITKDIIFALRKAGWLKSDFDEEDRRLRNYTLVDPTEIVTMLDIPESMDDSDED